jgi:hypothetical protein
VTQSIAPKTGDRLILRGADGYDEARFARVFNARRPERYLAAVLVAETADDVVEGVRLARDRGWKVAIRAGGHSFPAWSLRDDGPLIDLGAFKETAFDESTGLVSVTPRFRAESSTRIYLGTAASSPPVTVPRGAGPGFCGESA